MDLTFQVPMQYCSLQHRTLLLSPVTSTAGYCFQLDIIFALAPSLHSFWSYFSTDPRGVRPRLEGKPRTPLSSRVATRVSRSPLSGFKGVQPPLPFGERTRDCSPGHAGKEGPQLARTGASQGQKNIYFCFIDYTLTVWITINCGKFLKRWEYQTT